MLQFAGNPKSALGLIRCRVETGTAPGSHMDRKWILMRVIRQDSINFFIGNNIGLDYPNGGCLEA